MTDLFKYRYTYIPVKYFLNCYRALSDGQSAVLQLQNLIESERFYFSDWKIVWIGACTILRTSIDLFQVDARSCLDGALRREIAEEWQLIAKEKEKHAIFWEFLRRERNNLIHAYEWGAYELWMDIDGNLSRPKLSLLDVRPPETRSVLRMRSGPYAGHDSLTLLQMSSEWVQERIYAAIFRAGYTPEEYRNISNFQKKRTLLDVANQLPEASNGEVNPHSNDDA